MLLLLHFGVQFSLTRRDRLNSRIESNYVSCNKSVGSQLVWFQFVTTLFIFRSFHPFFFSWQFVIDILMGVIQVAVL